MYRNRRMPPNNIAFQRNPHRVSQETVTAVVGRTTKHTCRFKDAVCHNCKKQGHLAKVCHSKPDDKKTHRLEEDVKETQFVGVYNVE